MASSKSSNPTSFYRSHSKSFCDNKRVALGNIPNREKRFYSLSIETDSICNNALWLHAAASNHIFEKNNILNFFHLRRRRREAEELNDIRKSERLREREREREIGREGGQLCKLFWSAIKRTKPERLSCGLFWPKANSV